MEEISQELFEELTKPVVRKKPATRRAKKQQGRTYRVWFYETEYEFGPKCENANCVNPFGHNSQTATAIVDDLRMCRYCYIAGWGASESSD